MLHYGISGYFQALANFLNDASKSVSPEKKIKKETQKVSVAGFDSLRNVYIYIYVVFFLLPIFISRSTLTYRALYYGKIETQTSYIYIYIYMYFFFY